MENFLKEIQHLKIQLNEIKSATNNFHESNFIGKEGFGMVYQGVVSHSKGKSKVAFKRLDRNFGQGDSEFWKEITMLSSYTHENLISLLGFCDDDGEKILVYEYAFHGSLDRHLGTLSLLWRKRLEICLTAAKGLFYLHDPNGTHKRIIHRDIKSSNILLDENWKAKISDMGLSKIGPANQQHSFLATNCVGTYGYIDPVYMETCTLTKESDIYSFGVVLFEVLCGRLCYKLNNRGFKCLVPTWKQSYVEKKLDEIIFHELKQQMDPKSLETFSNIAYQCLQKSRKGRPKMSQVVETLENALRFQEIFEEGEPPTDYVEMSKTTIPPLVYSSQEELKMLLSKGVFVNGGNTNGEHCEMISATECLTPINFASSSFPFLRRKKSRADKREDGWLMAELYQFTSDTRNVDLEISFECRNPLAVEAIEFRPLERVEHQVLENEDLEDIQTDTYWEQKLPTDYADMIKLSKHNLECTTKKDLHFLLRKGFLTDHDRVWLSIAKNGKKCIMQPTRVCLNDWEWRWQKKGRNVLQESRFSKVAFDPHRSFEIRYSSDMASPQTRYALYLVYKLQEDHPGLEPPVKVSMPGHSLGLILPWYIYLVSHTPIIRRKIYQNTHNASNISKMKGLPQQRDDGWMEVQVWEFQTGNTTKWLTKSVRLTPADNMSL